MLKVLNEKPLNQISDNFRYNEQYRQISTGDISYQLFNLDEYEIGMLDLKYTKELGKVAISYVVLNINWRHKGLGKVLYKDIPFLVPPRK